jgi:hypothetical protein
MADEWLLEEMLSLWQREAAQGRDVAAAELCRDHPGLLPELELRIRAVQQMDNLAGKVAEAAAPSAATDLNAVTLDPGGTRPGGATPPCVPANANGASIPGYVILSTLGRGAWASSTKPAS